MKALLGCLLVAILAASATAIAAPILTASILNNDQVVGPHDVVSFTARFSNTGDEAFPSQLGGIQSISVAPASPPYGIAFADFVDLEGLLPGASIDINFLRAQPSPPGAPAGDYSGYYTGTVTVTPPLGGPPLVLGEWDLQMRWSVPVPEPGSLALLGLGLAGLAAARRRKAA